MIVLVLFAALPKIFTSITSTMGSDADPYLIAKEHGVISVRDITMHQTQESTLITRLISI